MGTDALFAGRTERKLSELSAGVLQDLVVRSSSGLAHPHVRWRLQKLVNDCEGDPLVLLRSAASSAEMEPSIRRDLGFPLHVFGNSSTNAATRGFDIADPHLHSGASPPLPLFFAGLASAQQPIRLAQLEDSIVLGGDGHPWALGPLLQGLRYALRVMTYVSAGQNLADEIRLTEARLDGPPADALLNGSFWDSVAEHAQGEQRPSFAEVLDRELPPTPFTRVHESFWAVADASSFQARGPFLTGAVRAICAVAEVVEAKSGDGLSRFVDRFEEMGIVRDAAFGDLKKWMVGDVLEEIAASPSVVGAEFRKTIIETSPRDFKRAVKGALASHHRAFARFAQDTHRRLALTMPAGFLRRPVRDVGGWTDFEQLRSGLAGYEALREIRSEHDRLIAAIHSIDVAGDETGSASWPFALVAELLRREEVPLVYSIHAGESFYSAFNGVRRVGELFLADRPPDRIGHALALSRRAAERICDFDGATPIRKGDLIADLAWAVLRDFSRAQDCKALLAELVTDGHGRQFAPEAWVRAYGALFSADALSDASVVSATKGHVGQPNEDARGALMQGTDYERALSALIWGDQSAGGYAFCDVSGAASDEERARALELGDAMAAEARRAVRADCMSNDVLIEACPTSNVRLANLGPYEAHPLWKWSRRGMDVIIGSDDPVVFGTTILDEFDELLASGPRPRVETLAAATVNNCSGGVLRRAEDFAEVAYLAS